jgi:SAM-dependent methyltransferase
MPSMLDYDSREARHRFIAQNFGEFISGSVINIGGGGEKHFLKFIQPKEYLELDISGRPDIKADLDHDFPLPIEDNRFDTVICTDVLEHLDELHRVFRELLRISRRYVIISVPNALTEIRHYLRRRKYVGDAGRAGEDVGFHTKFYGLPAKKPADRHRWFFSYTEAESFFRRHADETGYKIVLEKPVGDKGSSLIGRAARLGVGAFLGKAHLKDLFYGTYWCVLEKKSAQ